MPQDNSTLRTNAGTAKIPAKTIASGGQGQIVVVTLNYGLGKTYQPLDVIDALEVKYGAGKVLSNRDTVIGGVLDLTIIP